MVSVRKELILYIILKNKCRLHFFFIVRNSVFQYLIYFNAMMFSHIDVQTRFVEPEVKLINE